ncbi:bifunctional DNA-formamidopyrimidine glycosylase/DNA-(apurinic or apyrimidinic site) lyase [Gulosibacter macacae]|uniref:Formamidopyrimidine-DNA glycosylase n=1 Tax=Gulosibacter macacae TaxID=2488791 RepID=A0A3P3VTN9_9MICO|nr:bifunctional DNA-formamidopyrimidine glycosylase/DNA-(apurinic or apyrimidinic site) lyase [Gulosibacter macacae]RRJ86171.1 bifunctional DNA-formamidopyrimidine glycosylase/DNA-(apurinic or apyrimidinic site) lyase [Gulosibacter macacae]
MPELPEVEVVRRGLGPAVTGARIVAVDVVDERALKRHAGTALDFVDRLEGRMLAEPSRRGKFLWLPLSNAEALAPPCAEVLEARPSSASGRQVARPSITSGHELDRPTEALIGHLGMSGQLLIQPVGRSDERQLCIRLRLEGPGGEHELRFVDQRRFGSLAVDALIAPTDAPDERIPTQVLHIARDPLDSRFDDAAFRERLRTTMRGIKAVILDQQIIAGVGNIYADEALWRARLHGSQPAATISTRKARELLAHIREVFEQALREGGTSFDDLYVNVNGESGYFERSLKAYGREGEPCERCGTRMRRERFMNRSSYFCPKCQRLRERAR